MLFKDVIEFKGEVESQNDGGDVIMLPTWSDPPIFANIKSVKRSEFYQAMSNGLKPEKVFQVRINEYNNEKYLRHEGKEYSIIRTYESGGEFLEIICEGIANATT